MVNFTCAAIDGQVDIDDVARVCGDYLWCATWRKHYFYHNVEQKPTAASIQQIRDRVGLVQAWVECKDLARKTIDERCQGEALTPTIAATLACEQINKKYHQVAVAIIMQYFNLDLDFVELGDCVRRIAQNSLKLTTVNGEGANDDSWSYFRITNDLVSKHAHKVVRCLTGDSRYQFDLINSTCDFGQGWFNQYRAGVARLYRIKGGTQEYPLKPGVEYHVSLDEVNNKVVCYER